MFPISEEGMLMCDRVGHVHKSIEAVCMKKGCQEPIPCCRKCVMKEHKNHLNNDFVEISEIKRQANSSLKYLNQLDDLSQSICEVYKSWQKQLQKRIDQLRGELQLSENPTLTQLSNYVIRVREKKVDQQEAEIFRLLKNEMAFIKQRLIQLQKEVNLRFTLTQQLEGHDSEVRYVAISNNDKYFASQSSDPSKVILWDVKSNQQIAERLIQRSIISALQFSNDNSMLAVCSSQEMWSDGIIEIFDLTNFKNSQAKIKLEGHNGIINRIKFTDDSKNLISVSRDLSLRVWDLNENKEIYYQQCDGELYGVAYSHQQKLIACCGWNGFCYLFDLKNTLEKYWQAHSQQSNCIEFIRNSTTIMTSSSKETRFWQVKNLLDSEFNYFKEIKEGGFTVKAYPIDNPEIIINCSLDCKFVNLWSYDSTELIKRLEIPNKLQKQSFVITSDFKKIITGGQNTLVQIFEQN